jgi:hypothetical protein
MRLPLALLAILATGCAIPGGGAPTRSRAPDYSAREIRRPAVFVRVAGWPDLNDRERQALADTYEGALVEALDARGVPPTDVQRVVPGERFDARAALARAREVGAEHAIIVDLGVSRRDAMFCRESARPFRAITTVWSQGVQVLRVGDGASRMAIAAGQDLDVTELDADCGNPRRSTTRDRAAMVAAAVEALTPRILGR